MQNAPYVIENFYSFICLLALVMTTAFVNSAASREFAFNTDQLVFSTQIRKLPYLSGRFLGSALISVIPMLGRIRRRSCWPSICRGSTLERWGPVVWPAHLNGILLFALPNTLLIAAVVFAIAVLTRSTIASFVGALVLLTAYSAPQAFTTDLKNETIAALLDPFAIRTYGLVTKYWTVADKNHMVLGWSGLLLWNRIIWLVVAALVFLFAYWRFSFAQRSGKVKRKQKQPPLRRAAASSDPGSAPRSRLAPAAHLRQLWHSTRLEFKVLVKSTIFIVLALAALLNCLSQCDLQRDRRLRRYFPAGDVQHARPYRRHALRVFARDHHLLRRRAYLGGTRCQGG